MVGVNEDENKVLPSTLQEDGNYVVLLGHTTGEFGGSLYIKKLFGETIGSLAEIDYKAELGLWRLVIEANTKGLLKAAKDVNLGGIAIALSKMAARSDRGVVAEIALEQSRDIFDESQARAIVEVGESDWEAFRAMAEEIGVSADIVGKVGGDMVKINEVSLPLAKVKEVYFNRFAEVIEQDL
jgi:phosphoribosylformylglycinamidine synthase